MNDLSSLIERLEKASSATSDPALASDIWLWSNGLRNIGGYYAEELATGKHVRVDYNFPGILGSIDAALALVERKLPGSGWERIIQPDNTVVVHVWSEDAPGRAFETPAGTPVAIILALLRALQSSHPATASGIVERESGDAQ